MVSFVVFQFLAVKQADWSGGIHGIFRLAKEPGFDFMKWKKAYIPDIGT